jgi:hypothetical protein
MAGGRIRTLKPEILEDEKTAPLSDTAFRLFTSMVILSDDHGNVRCDVRWLSSQIWWAHESKPNVLLALIELCRATLIEVYGVRGGTYAHLRGWEKHQRIDNAGKCKVPRPDDADANPIQVDESISDKLAATRGEIPRTAAGREGKGEEGNGIGLDGEAAAKTPPAKPDKRKCRIPSDWEPRPEEQQKARELGVDCEAESAQFRDHYTAKGEARADWDASFRTWLRNAVRFGKGRQQPAQRDVFALIDGAEIGKNT